MRQSVEIPCFQLAVRISSPLTSLNRIVNKEQKNDELQKRTNELYTLSITKDLLKVSRDWSKLAIMGFRSHDPSSQHGGKVMITAMNICQQMEKNRISVDGAVMSKTVT